MECSICRNPATYICRCRRPATYFCGRDLEVHKKQSASLNHKSSPYPILPSKESKNILLDHIENLCKDSQNQIENLNIKTDEIKEFLANNLHSLLENLSKCCDEKGTKLLGFIQDMRDLSKYIRNLDIIDVKDFYTPLENALLNVDEARRLASEMEGPLILYPQFLAHKLFMMKTSNVYHLIGNYNFLVHLSDSRIQYKYPDGEIETQVCENLSSTSRALKVSENSLVITGGDNIPQCALIINKENSFIDNLSLLEKPRKNHAMVWINNKPAVLGGENPMHPGKGHEVYNSVEIFESNSWVRFTPMCKARNKPTACNYLDKVYVFGGFDHNEIHVKSIEVLEDNIWKEVLLDNSNFPNITVPVPVIYSHSNLVLLLGSEGGIIYFDVSNQNSNFIIEYGTIALNSKEHLNKNSHNHAFIKKGFYNLLNNNENLISKYGVFF